MHQTLSSRKTFQRKEDYEESGYLVNDWVNGEKDAQRIEGPRPGPLDEVLVDWVVHIRQEWLADARILEKENAQRGDDEEVEEAPCPGGNAVKIVKQRRGYKLHLCDDQWQWINGMTNSLWNLT